jgi:hypothetical protein
MNRRYYLQIKHKTDPDWCTKAKGTFDECLMEFFDRNKGFPGYRVRIALEEKIREECQMKGGGYGEPHYQSAGMLIGGKAGRAGE